VFVDEVLPHLQKTVGADVITAAGRTRADQRRRAQRDKLRNEVRSPRYAALLLTGERWTMSAAPADSELLQDMAKTTLQRSVKKLFKLARFFAALTPERRHRVRIQAKRLRYALDLFSVVLPKRATARYIDATAELQDLLGELNDAAVARTMFLQLGRGAKLPKAVDQWFAANECAQLRQVEVRLMVLAEMPASWQ
jgi:triphosphatase